MAYSVSTSEFGKMGKKERAEAVRLLARGAFESPNGDAGQIDAQIDAYEERYGFDSRELTKRLIADEQQETDEVSDWLWLLNFRRDRVS